MITLFLCACKRRTASHPSDLHSLCSLYLCPLSFFPFLPQDASNLACESMRMSRVCSSRLAASMGVLKQNNQKGMKKKKKNAKKNLVFQWLVGWIGLVINKHFKQEALKVVNQIFLFIFVDRLSNRERDFICSAGNDKLSKIIWFIYKTWVPKRCTAERRFAPGTNPNHYSLDTVNRHLLGQGDFIFFLNRTAQVAPLVIRQSRSLPIST